MARRESGREARSGGRRAALAVVTLVTAGALTTACSEAGVTSQALPAAPTTTVPATTTTGPAVAPAGFTSFTSAADGFSIAVPADWRQVDPASPGAARAIEELVKSNAKLAPLLSNVDLAAQGIKFLAVSGSAASVNVVVKPALGAVDSDLPQIAEQIKDQYRSLGASLRSEETVQLAGHAALRLTIDLRLTTPAGERTTLREVQYFLVANDLAYILTMAGESPQFPAIAATFEVT